VSLYYMTQAELITKRLDGKIASIDNHNSYSLVGCTVSPGFDYNDWKLGDMETLAKTYPQHKSIIEKYTRPRT
jgi:predicted cupin superfamily sugar epimerase